MAAVPPTPVVDHGRYFTSLDGLRGYAFLGIIAAHVIELWDGVEIAWQLRIPNLLIRCAWAGIDGFFVLSGFLITGILLRSRGRPHALKVFYFRRTLRIFPPYYLLLAILAAWLVYTTGDGGAPLEPARLSYWVYMQNFFIGLQGWDSFRALSHLWSLAVEEQFYLLWPFLVLWLPLGRLKWVLVGMLVFAPLLRWYMLANGSGYAAVYVLLFTRIDALAGGALMALVLASEGGPERLARWAPRMIGVAFLAILAMYLARRGYFLTDPVVQVVGYSVNIMGWVGVFSFLAFAPRTWGMREFFAWPPFRWLGNRSYGGYLYHWPIAILVHQWLSATALTPLWGIVNTMLVTTVLTLLAAELSWRLVEAPVLGMRNLYNPGARLAPPNGRAAIPE